MTRREALDERAAEIVLRALDEDRLGRGGADDAGGDDGLGEELRTEVRRHLDLLGLLPAALQERPLPPAAKRRLMTAIREAEAQEPAEADGEPAVVGER